MKLLTIGNSFSINACRFLPEILADAGMELLLGCANIGGCPLELHLQNAENDVRRYGDEYEGDHTLREMLELEDWDFVTIQQASHDSWRAGTYFPAADGLAAFIHAHAPRTQIVVHQTWAYRTDNPRLTGEYKIRQSQMFALLKENYQELAEKLGAPILPVGEAMRIMQLETNDPVGQLTRLPDYPSHANDLGEYLGGLVWYAGLTGGDPEQIRFVPEGLEPDLAAAARRSAAQAAAMYR